jgi:lipoprotein NlpI
MVALLALSLTPAGPIAAQSTNETECIDTNEQFSPDVVIGACTALLDSGQLSTADQARVLTSRGNGYFHKGDLDRALVDYNQAIAFNPWAPEAFYDRGLVYEDKADVDRAISDYDEALRLGIADRFGKVKASSAGAHYGRGLARLHRGDIDGAIADDTVSIKLVSTNAFVFFERGCAYDMKGAHDLAIADYTTAINLVPTDDVEFYIARGAARFDTAQYRAATADLALAMQMWPTNIEVALWLYIARTRAGTGNPRAAITLIYLQHQAPKASSRWPYPLVELFFGSRTAAATLAAAETSHERCEAGFYVGEWDLMHGKRDQATRLLQSAARTCEAISIESGGAKSELKRLGAG